MNLSSVPARSEAVANDGILVHADQAARLADAAALGNVVQERDDLLIGQTTLEEGSAFSFGEAIFTGFAVEEPAALFAVMTADGQSSGTSLAIVRAVRVLTAEASQVVHDSSRRGPFV
jgi:hypothetical protein